MPAATLKAEWAMSRSYDLETDERGNIRLLSGLSVLPQRIAASLSLQRSESPAYPEAGSKLGRYFFSMDKALQPRLVQLEIIRLAAVPIADMPASAYRTSLQCVERVRSVDIRADVPERGWLPVRVELEVNGIGRWTHELVFLLGRHAHDTASDTGALARLAERLPDGVSPKLVSALARDCPDGLGRKNYRTEDIKQLQPQLTAQEIEDQVHLLEARGLVRLAKYAGGKWHLKLSQAFYEQIDPDAVGSSPADDAKVLVLQMLNNETGQAAAIHKVSGWDRRRFNPAFRCVMHQVPSNFVSQEHSAQYPCASILWKPEVKAALISVW